MELLPALSIDRAWSLLAAPALPRLDVPRLRQQARTFFEAELAVVQTISDPTGLLPDRASIEIDIAPLREATKTTRVRLITLPLIEAPAVRAAADEGVAAIGGAGFDALVPKATRLWQVDTRLVQGSDERVAIVLAGVLASVLLSPIVPPGGRTIFGVKGARLRLESLRWPHAIDQSPA